MPGFDICLKWIALLAMSGVLTGCGFFIGKDGLIHDSQHDYRQAKTIPVINVPEQYGQLSNQELYPIPGLSPSLKLPGEFKAPPPEIFINSSKSEVRLYKDGNKYWLSTSLPPADAWSRMRNFWELHDIELDYQRPEKGIFESQWLSRKNNTNNMLEKFRLRVEHGMLRNSSEVYLMRVEYPASETMPTSESIDWTQTTDGDPLVESVIQEMGRFIIQTEYDAASASLLAQRFTGKPKSSLETDADGNNYLKLTVDRGRAWIVVGKAIEDARLEKAIEDEERGIYLVNFYPKSKPSFGSRLSIFSRSSKNIEAESGPDGDLKLGKVRSKKGSAYRMALKLSVESEQIIVRVLRDEASTGQTIGNALIEKIRENLI